MAEQGAQFNMRFSDEDMKVLQAGAFVNGLTLPKLIHQTIEAKLYERARVYCEAISAGELDVTAAISNFLWRYESVYRAETPEN